MRQLLSSSSMMWFNALAFLLAAPFLLGEWRLMMDGRFFDPDTLRLYGYFRYYDPALFVGDYTTDYLLSAWEPWGYKALAQAWARIADPLLLHRWLLIVLWVGCLPAVYNAGMRLGGRYNAWATLWIYACSSIFIFRMTGAMAHSFGFPLMWGAVAAYLGGHYRWLSAVTVASAALYPIITPVAGLMLAMLVLMPRQVLAAPLPAIRLREWSWLAATALVVMLCIAPFFLQHQTSLYGRSLHIPGDRTAFRELDNPLAAINPFLYVTIAYALQHGARWGLEFGQALTLAMIGLLLAGFLLHDKRDLRLGQLKFIALPSLLVFCLSLFFNIDNAYRFAIYTLPVLIALMLPLALYQCFRFLPTPFDRWGWALAVLAYLACINVADPRASGYLFKLQPFQARALDYIGTLPKDAMIAGWPGDRNGRIIEAVPYVARRKALVTWAGHALSHETYVLTLRERMQAITEAYLAQDIAPILALRDRFHVDYLIINEADFQDQPPRYIPPFTEQARQLWDHNLGKHFAVLALAKLISVYSQDGIDILDLHQLP